VTIAVAGKFTHDSIWSTIHFYHCARPKVIGRDVSRSSCLTYSPPMLYLQQPECVMDSRHAPHCGPALRAGNCKLTLSGRLANNACPPMRWQLLQWPEQLQREVKVKRCGQKQLQKTANELTWAAKWSVRTLASWSATSSQTYNSLLLTGADMYALTAFRLSTDEINRPCIIL